MKYEVFWDNPGYKGYPQLREDIECDYLIVGGGVTGVSLAYFLRKYGGKKIVLIEKNTIASGATGKAAGSIVLQGELDLYEILEHYGEEKGNRYWKLSQAYLKAMKDIIRKEHVRCDYDPEDIVYGSAQRKNDVDILNEYIAERDVGELTTLLAGKELRKEVNTPLFKYAILSEKHGVSVNPLQFTQNLSKVVAKKGVSIYENTPLLKDKNNVVHTPKGTIKYKKIILALDAFHRHAGIKRINSTIVVTKRLTKAQLKKIALIPKKIIWDSKDVYHYLKITRDNRILLGYGDKHVRKGHDSIDPHDPHLERIKSFLEKLFPQIRAPLEYAWSGSFGCTPTKIPLIEHSKNHTLVGGSASQLSCLMSSDYIAHHLMGKKSKLDEFFNK